MAEETHILREALALLLFQTCRLLWQLYQGLSERLSGRAQLRREARGTYSRSAELLDIERKYCFDPLGLPNMTSCFMLRSAKFVHPDYVFRPEVSLYCVNEKEAVFVEAPPGVETWRNECGSFHRQAQYDYAQKIIKMPLKSFLEVTEELEDPGEKLTFAHCIPRSGSTLLGQIFEVSEQVVSYSEPDALTWPFLRFADKASLSEEFKTAYLHSVVRFMCRPELNNNNSLGFMVKVMDYFVKEDLALYKSCFPKARFLFLHRNGAQCTFSSHCLLQLTNLARLVQLLRRFIPARLLAGFIIADAGAMVTPDAACATRWQHTIKHAADHQELLYNVVVWASAIHRYQQQHADGQRVYAVKYEDLVEDPQRAVAAILRFCRLPQHMLHACLKAFEQDSQKHSILSRDRMARVRALVQRRTEQDSFLADCDALCSDFEVPSLNQDVRLPNTITSCDTSCHVMHGS